MLTMSEQQSLWRCDRVISSDAAACRQVLNDVVEQLEARHWVQRDVFSIHLAIEEALSNAIQHGNHFDTAKHIRVSCCLYPHRVRIEIADEGGGFNPEALPDPTCDEQVHQPTGRGVMLMKAFMSRVEFNNRGNGVTMEKERGHDEDG